MALDLKTPVGPLPLGAWIVIVGAGLGVNFYLRRNSTAPVPVEAGPENPDVGQGGSGWIPVPPPTTPDQDVAKPKTNEEWGSAAIRWLIARNYDPSTADSAVRKYLISGQLSLAEYAMIGIVLAGLGPPPYPLGEPAPPPVAPPPVVQPPPPPPVTNPSPPPPPPPIAAPQWPKRHVVSRGEHLSGIALRYYGSGSRASYMKIFNANRHLTNNPDYIQAGWTLTIPAP